MRDAINFLRRHRFLIAALLVVQSSSGCQKSASDANVPAGSVSAPTAVGPSQPEPTGKTVQQGAPHRKDELTLPKARGIPTSPDWVQIEITKSSIRFAGSPVVALNHGELDDADVPDHLVSKLYEDLTPLSDQLRQTVVFVNADEHTPFTTLMHVLHTASRSGATRFALAVDDSTTSEKVARILSPGRTTGPTVRPPALSLSVLAEKGNLYGTHSVPSTSGKTRFHIPPVQGGQSIHEWDFDALTRAAENLAVRTPPDRDLNFSATRDTPISVLTSVLDSTLGPNCDLSSPNGADCWFSRVVVESKWDSYPYDESVEGHFQSSAFGRKGEEDSNPNGVKPGLHQDVIRKVIRSNVNLVTECYNKALEKDRSTQGKVVVNFVIGGDGKVVSSTVTESFGKDELDHCIADAIKGLRFPAPIGGGNVIITYPFKLTAN